jgi:two-component system sensor histidine kinase/response regulator
MNAETASLILVADDEEPTLEILTTVVKDLGHQVLAARDGEEALRLALHHVPDLIITDFMMPRRTGVELIRALRTNQELAATPIILISAASPAGAKDATRFFGKPVHLGDLEETIARLLADRPSGPHERVAPVEGPVSPSARPEALNWLAHELKSPLSAVRMSVELLRRRIDIIGNEQDQSRVQVVLRGLDRMTGLMNSVLDAAAIGEGKLALRLTSVDLVAFVQRTVALWRDLNPGVEFALTAPAEPVPLQLDELRAQQILENLLSNAVKYGGTNKRVEILIAARGGQIVVSVRDFGPGIPAAELPHLFERFHRAAGTSGHGHGLGLLIAAALAKLHGGTLAVSSTLGRGSTFSLSLPRART